MQRLSHNPPSRRHAGVGTSRERRRAAARGPKSDRTDKPRRSPAPTPRPLDANERREALLVASRELAHAQTRERGHEVLVAPGRGAVERWRL